MSQVSKIDDILAGYWSKNNPSSEYLGKEYDHEEAKQALLTIILEALPEKETVAYSQSEACETEGFNRALEEVKEAINEVFGVEG